MRVDHAANGFECAFRPPFLNKADDRVEDDDRDDNRCIDEIADHGGKHGRGKQDVDQKVMELQQKAHEGAALLHIREAVRAVTLPARYRFAGAQPVLQIDMLRG